MLHGRGPPIQKYSESESFASSSEFRSTQNSELFFICFDLWATNLQNRKAPHLKLSAKKNARSPQTPVNKQKTEFPESVFSVKAGEYPFESTHLHNCWDSVQRVVVQLRARTTQKKKNKLVSSCFPQEPLLVFDFTPAFCKPLLLFDSCI